MNKVRTQVLSILLALVAMLGAGAADGAPARAAAYTPGPCAAVAAAEPQSGHTAPPPAPVMFASDFPALTDCEWGFPLGGWGGVRRGAPRNHVPVVFIHGNQADAENWFAVREQFRVLAGYTDQEMYALSYNGLENGYAGLPLRTGPVSASLAYFQANPNVFANGGHGTGDDVNVPDVYAFIRAVQDYTGSRQVNVVAHSLGATIVRKLLLVHPELRPDVLASVLIAGANHGTSVCRGIDQYYFGCDEIAPGTAWLEALNQGGGSPGPTCWMTVYNGLEGDPFFTGPDEQSPHLDGAFNLQFAGYYHNDLRVDPAIVPAYLHFLAVKGQLNSPRCGSGPRVPSATSVPAPEIAKAEVEPGPMTPEDSHRHSFAY